MIRGAASPPPIALIIEPQNWRTKSAHLCKRLLSTILLQCDDASTRVLSTKVGVIGPFIAALVVPGLAFPINRAMREHASKQKCSFLFTLAGIAVLLSCGGRNPGQATQSKETWIQINGPGPGARYAHTAVLDSKRHNIVVFDSSPSELQFAGQIARNFAVSREGYSLLSSIMQVSTRAGVTS